MANACVILKNLFNTDMGASSKLLEALKSHGYSFNEVHILSQNDIKNICTLLEEFTAKGMPVVILSQEGVDGALKEVVLPPRKCVFHAFLNGIENTVCALNDEYTEKDLVSLLKAQNLKISVAEPFTGGGIAKRITSVSGASEVYFEGINAYNELSKIKRLGVSKDTLMQYGAVSKETAYEMACGLLNSGDCDVALATTGLAGPNTDSSGKPVGLCYITVGVKTEVQVYEYRFEGSRSEITEKAINRALRHACQLLQNLNLEK